MNFEGITYKGPEISDIELLEQLPSSLSGLLRQINGAVLFQGGIHIRGVCTEPTWHSLGYVWTGKGALHTLFPVLSPDDIPFAQDCLGDQFLLRADQVIKLCAETGELEPLGLGFQAFLEAVCDDAVEYLDLQPLLQFMNETGPLEPGSLINVWPPFCTEEAANGVSLRAVTVVDRINFLADLAMQLPEDGEQVKIQIVE